MPAAWASLRAFSSAFTASNTFSSFFFLAAELEALFSDASEEADALELASLSADEEEALSSAACDDELEALCDAGLLRPRSAAAQKPTPMMREMQMMPIAMFLLETRFPVFTCAGLYPPLAG
jgi:hypothetical protein